MEPNPESRFVSSEQPLTQASGGALEQRVASVLQAFDAQGNHRTGTAVDTASAEWLADHPKWMLANWRCEQNGPRDIPS